MATQEAVMTTQDIANRLEELFKGNKWMEAQEELFSQDAESIEPPNAPGARTVKGLDAIKKKSEEWNKTVEKVHGSWSGKPVVAGNHIAVAMGIDISVKGMGRRKMDEIVVYEVKDGKIVKEQFFY